VLGDCRLLSEYMQLAPADMLQDAVSLMAGEAVLRVIHTHDGCRVGCMVAAYSTPKERKKLLKAMKGHIMKMAMNEFAYIVLIKVLEVVDDTQLARKCAVQELTVRHLSLLQM
jgi:pumilio homology domain family member 6